MTPQVPENKNRRAVGDNQRYRIIRHLGRGGMGEVFEVIDAQSGEHIALKTLPDTTPESLHRFKREFRALADIVHPNVVRLYELGYDQGQELWFFTMERVRGTDVIAALRTQEPSAAWTLSGHPPPMDRWDLLRSVFSDIASGIAAIHSAGKLHRDLKPPNVLLGDDGRVVILDFGLVTDSDPATKATTLEVGVAGTPAYMAPEQAAGEAASEASDWYALGVMLFEALTGELPFSGNMLQVLANKREHPAPTPAQKGKGVPSDLNQLCIGLLDRDPGRRPPGPDIAARLSAPLRRKPMGVPAWRPGTDSKPVVAVTPVALIGRDQELAQLQAAVARAQDEPVLISLSGPSGIGKTALLDALLTRVEERDMLVIRGRCHERETVPFKAIDSTIDALSRSLRRMYSNQSAPAGAPDLLKIFPILGRIEALAQSDQPLAANPSEMRRRAFACLSHMVAGLAQERPLVLAIDDIQWGDEDSAALLGDVLAHPARPRIAIVCVSQSERTQESPFLQALRQRRNSRLRSVHWLDLELGPLSTSAARELLAAFWQPRPPAQSKPVESDAQEGVLSPETAQAILEEAQGNPFLLEQLTRNPSTGTRIRGTSLTAVVKDRIEELSKPAQRLLEVIAAAGRPLLPAVAIRAADADANALLELRRDSWVRSTGVDKALEPYHDRLRVALLSHLSKERLEEIHSGLVTEQKRAGGANDEELGEHCQATGDLEGARQHFRAAADAAGAALAFGQAARLYRRALDLSGGDAATVLLVPLADALSNAGRGKEAAEFYLRAAASTGAEEADAHTTRAAEHLLYAGYVDEAIAIFARALAKAGMPMAKTPRRALWSMASRRTLAKIRGTKFIESNAREVPPRELARIDTAWHTATGLLPIDTISGLDFQARHLQLALNSGEPFRIARALAIEGGSIATRGQKMRPRVNRLLARAREIATRCGDPRALGIVEMSAGVAAYVLGDWVKSIEHCDAADSILADQCTGAVWELATARRFGLGALYYAGRLRELSQRSRVWLNDAINRGDLYAATNIRTGPANAIWLMDDDPEQARHEVRQAAQQWSQGGFHTQHFYATYTEVQIDLYQGDYNRAWRRVCELWKPLKRALLFRVELIRVEALVLRARAALASNHLKDADRCMRRLNRERSATARASALLVAAQRAQARGDGDDVATLFTSAADGFDVAAMSLHRMAAHYAQARAGLGTTFGDTVLQSLHKLGVADPQRFLSMLAPQSA